MVTKKRGSCGRVKGARVSPEVQAAWDARFGAGRAIKSQHALEAAMRMFLALPDYGTAFLAGQLSPPDVETWPRLAEAFEKKWPVIARELRRKSGSR